MASSAVARDRGLDPRKFELRGDWAGYSAGNGGGGELVWDAAVAGYD